MNNYYHIILWKYNFFKSILFIGFCAIWIIQDPQGRSTGERLRTVNFYVLKDTGLWGARQRCVLKENSCCSEIEWIKK